MVQACSRPPPQLRVGSQLLVTEARPATGLLARAMTRPSTRTGGVPLTTGTREEVASARRLLAADHITGPYEEHRLRKHRTGEYRSDDLTSARTNFHELWRRRLDTSQVELRLQSRLGADG